MEKIIKGIAGTLIGLGLVYGIVTSEYMDLPFPFTKHDQGRTKNAISTIVAGVVAQQLYENSSIDLEIKKQFFPDARVTGNTTKDSIETNVDLTFTENIFNAQRNPSTGFMQGKVDKSEIDWKVNQTSQTTYEIARLGPKFDSTLKLTIGNGQILGEYERPGPNIDWDINGTYSQNGNVGIEIDGPLTLGVNLEGKISKR